MVYMKSVDPEVREEYLKVYTERGIDEAITLLHNDIGVLEPKVFDGGFKQERFDHVQSLRLLAQELWNIKLREQTAKSYGEAAATKSFGKSFAKT